MVPLGISEAACAVIGGSIGENKVSLSKAYFRLVIFYSAVSSILIGVLLSAFRFAITSLYTTE